jgi:iron complex outermembrane recepter protein
MDCSRELVTSSTALKRNSVMTPRIDLASARNRRFPDCLTRVANALLLIGFVCALFPVAAAAEAAGKNPGVTPTTSNTASGAAGSPSRRDAETDETVVLSAFEVTTTEGRGYVSNNTVTGFKTHQELLKIPQAITVVTRDFINDIGQMNSSDILQYAGVSNFFKGESLAVRGSRISNALIDEMPNGVPYMDNVFIDSYEVIRGPAAVLYRSSSLGGVVLKNTKKPLPTAKQEVMFRLDEHGTYRGQFDATGPLGSYKDLRFSYRVVGAYQGGDVYFTNIEEKIVAIHPTFQVTYKDTTVRLGVDYQWMRHLPGGSNFLTEDGNIFTGAGRDESYFGPGGMEDFDYWAVRATVLHRISKNWEVKVGGAQHQYWRLGGVLLRNNVNYTTRRIRFTARKNDSRNNDKAVQADVLGNYKLFGIDAQSAFGFNAYYNWSKANFWASAAFGQQERSIDDPRMNEVHVPQIAEYIVPPSNPGSHLKSTGSNYYYQETLDFFSGRLSLVGGVTRSEANTDNISNITNPSVHDLVGGKETLHRYGVVLKPRKDLAFYAMESTTFVPSGARDINAQLLGSQQGKGREVGMKTSFLDGRISSTLSFFDIALTNVSVFGGVNSIGQSFNVPVGRTTQKGWDFDLALALTRSWQVMATGLDVKVRDQNNLPVSATYGKMWSLVTRYDFLDGELKGWAIGGGATRVGNRMISSTGITFTQTPARAFVEVSPGTMGNAFIAYRKGHWSHRVNVENVLDETFGIGLQQTLTVDPSPPRTFSFSTTYRF